MSELGGDRSKGGAGHWRRTYRRALAQTSAFIALACIASAGARATDAADPPLAPQHFEGRGIFYLEGQVRSPVGASASRSAFATNRLAIDDEHTRVEVDRAAKRIVLHNTHKYGLNDLVACLLLMGRGKTESGRSVPAAVHLKIHKTRNNFHTSLHPHPTVRGKLVSAQFEPFDVVLHNGEEAETVLTPAQAVEAVRDPELTARLANLFIQVTDHLEGQTVDFSTKGAPLVDLSLGFGAEQANIKLARVRLLSGDPANAELIRKGTVESMLERGDWEFRVDSLSPYIPKWYFERDLFLFGIEGLDAVQEISKRGLLRGETLVVGIRDGKGFISVGDERSEIPNPAEVARAYLEFHFVGGVVAQQVAEIPGRMK
jgi:hypothetical protein